MQVKTLERRPVSQRIGRLKPLILLAGVLLIVGGTGFMIVRQLKIDAARIVEDTLPGLVYAGQVNAELSENFARTLLVINADSTEERELYLKRIEEGSKRVDDSIQGYRPTIFEEEERQIFDRLVSARDKYREIRRRAFDLVKDGKRTEAVRLFETEVLPAYTTQKEAGEALFDYNVRQASERGKHIETLCSSTQWFVAVICVAIFVSGFFTPFFAIRLPPDIWK
jgi:CHASE3 domain sensor protein